MSHIALIGCGNWGQHILRDLKILDCMVTVVCFSDASIKRARDQGADQIINSVNQIQKPNGIVIATPTATHLDVIESVMHYNVPLFVEKPLGTNIEKASLIAKKMGEKIFVMDKWRYHPAIEMMGSIVKNGELGNILNLSITQFSWDCPHSDVDFIDILLPHTLSITQEILGTIPEPSKCHIIGNDKKPLVLQAWSEDSPSYYYHVAINTPLYRREIILEGMHSFAVLKDSYSNEIEIYRKIENKRSLPLTEKREIPNEMPLLRQLRVFIEFLNGGTAPKSNAQNGIQIMKKIARLRELANA